MHMRSTLPALPHRRGWPYPDVGRAMTRRSLRQGFTVERRDRPRRAAARRQRARVRRPDRGERDALDRRFWQGESMKELARSLDCTHAEAAAVLGHAVDKVRIRLAPDA